LRKVFGILLCLSMLAGCEKSEIEILQKRLDNFRNILPLELRHQFDAKDYQAVAKGIDSLLSTGSKFGQVAPDFREKYDRLKHEELINVFSPQEVVDYYREYFVEKIERLKKK
jgi:hypothetical protein